MDYSLNLQQQTAIFHQMALHYVQHTAPVLMLVISADGRIVSASRYADRVLGGPAMGRHVDNVLYGGLECLSALPRGAKGREELIFNVQTGANLAQSFLCTVTPLKEGWLIFGRQDMEEMAAMSQEMLALNQELNNLTRQLHMKNRELVQANQTILQLTRQDPLTGLANRRYLEERLVEIQSQANRQQRPFAVIITDIDQFKAVNDQFGHAMGDKVLKGFADLLTAATRQEDLAARFGGEEFMLVMPLTTDQQAYDCAERIRRQLPSLDLVGNGHAVTASFGVGEYRLHEPVQQVISRADNALYQAKRGGRNQTCLALNDELTST